MRICCARRKVPRGVDGEPIAPVSFKSILPTDEAREKIDLERKFDFEGHGAIRDGWVKSTTLAPHGFVLAGGNAIVIEKECAPGGPVKVPQQRCVLMALPEPAVDLKRAKLLNRRMGFTGEAILSCHLRRITELKAVGTVLLEFDYPSGEPLCDILKPGHALSTANIQQICRDLHGLLTFMMPAPGGSTPFRLCGLIHSSNVFLNEDGTLQSLLPIGCILSWAGVCAASSVLQRKGQDSCLAPEIKLTTQKNINLYFDDSEALVERAFASDGFAAATLTGQLLDLKFMDPEPIPVKATDFLMKATQHQEEFRLCGPDALCHPWMMAS